MNFEINEALRHAPAHPIDRAMAAPLAKSQLRFRLYVSALVLVVLVFALAFLGANALRFGTASAPAGVNILVVLLPLYVVVAFNRRVYSSMLFLRWRRASIDALGALAATVLAVLFVSFYLQASATMSRTVFAVGVGGSAVLIVIVRFGIHRLGRRLFAGPPSSALMIVDGVAIDPGPGIAAVDAAELDLRPDADDPRALDRLGRLLVRAERVVVACAMDRREAWAMVLKGANVRGEIVTPELAALGSLGAAKFDDRPTLIVSTGPLDLRNRALKRGLDLAMSSGILLFLAPLLALVALAVRIDSPGPVFFVQPRLGRGNRLFPMYKFRSMHTALCDVDGSTSTARGDARVTRVGRLIRATSIDELPQILNVLKGDMSIVGPRPHALGSLAGSKLFWEIDQRYWHRHAAKPGITGLAQVRGFRGATHMQSDLLDRLQSDLDYLNGWTIWRDLSILLATFRVVLHRNAY